MASIGSINNGERGSSVRNKLNQVIVEANKVDSKLDTSKLNGGTTGQVLRKDSDVDQAYSWADESIIAKKGVGLSVDKPVTGLTVGDIYVSTDSKLKFTATGATTWDAGVSLRTGIFVLDTSLTNFYLYQYNGSVVGLVGSGQNKKQQTLTSSASISMNANSGLNAYLSLGHTGTLTISNLVAGNEGNIVIDNTGSYTLTISPTPYVINDGAGDIALAASSRTILSYYYDGTDLNITKGETYTKA